MSTLTPIPDVPALAAAAAVTLGLGARDLAGRARQRLRAPSGARLCVYIGALALVAAYGVAVIGVAGWAWSPQSVVTAVVVGLVGGTLAVHLDRRLTRNAFRQAIRHGADTSTPTRTRPGHPIGLGAGRGLGRAAATSHDWAANEGFMALGPAGVILIAALEEIIFRGVLTTAALALPHFALSAAALLVACGAFGLGHAMFGPGQLAAKSVLAVISLIALLMTGVLLAAVLVHASLNFVAWRAAAAGS